MKLTNIAVKSEILNTKNIYFLKIKFLYYAEYWWSYSPATLKHFFIFRIRSDCTLLREPSCLLYIYIIVLLVGLIVLTFLESARCIIFKEFFLKKYKMQTYNKIKSLTQFINIKTYHHSKRLVSSTFTFVFVPLSFLDMLLTEFQKLLFDGICSGHCLSISRWFVIIVKNLQAPTFPPKLTYWKKEWNQYAKLLLCFVNLTRDLTKMNRALIWKLLQN